MVECNSDAGNEGAGREVLEAVGEAGSVPTAEDAGREDWLGA